jgi:NADH-quinone oxidoreductase subunit J
MYIFFSSLAIISSILMISCVNPINAVLFLILVFISVSMIFIMWNLEFLALIFIIVYVGAIAVLFLFIVMMINIKKIEKDNTTYLTIGIIIVLLFAFELLILIFNDKLEWNYLIDNGNNYLNYLNINNVDEVVRINMVKELGIVLFLLRPFLIYLAGLILLVAMIGSIYLTNIKRGFSMKKQFNQLSKRHEINIVNIY